MSAKLERRQGWPPLLPELFDWIEAGIPAVPGMRNVPGLHGIRIEQQLADGTYVVKAELPGIDPDQDVEISIDGDVLTIRAERAEKPEGKHHSEFRYGAFARSVRLPASARADETTADYKDGVLTVNVPVAEPKTGARTIKVQRADA
ncbi:Hsp20/alpha crystallin family protein [Streptomyces fildesensis]|uniref:Hsp20/alpha crystallin family protein n=1 Tax=Streptomyces fildesensis TaxID=375757 RepID=A0ABW8C6E0_9ACTN